MDRPGSRPFRATVYLPGHDDAGRGVVRAKIACTTEDHLNTAMAAWKAQGYMVTAYEVLQLPTPDEEAPDAQVPDLSDVPPQDRPPHP